MYHIVLVAALGGSGASIGWHEHQPYGTCGVTYECGCYGSGPLGASACPACGGGSQGPGYGGPGSGAFGGPGPGYVPDDAAPFNPVPLGAGSGTGTDQPPSDSPVPRTSPAGGGAGLVETTAAGRIVVALPADAKLVLGGLRSRSARPTRT